MRRTVAWVGSLLLSVGVMAGCRNGPSAGPEAGGGDEGVLRLAQTAEATTLDPAQVQDGPTIELLMHIFNGLVQWDSENKLVPDLAEKWEVSKDGRTYTFHLRKGVKFHDGSPLTADDLAYSIRRSLDPKTTSPVAMTYLNDLVGAAAFNSGKQPELDSVQAVDDATLRLTIDAPKAYFLAKLTYPTAYAVCKRVVEAGGGTIDESRMIGTGPFKISGYRRGDAKIVLDANPDYWEGAPKLKRIERRIILDNGARHDKFEAGELDLTDVTMAVYPADKANDRLAPLLHEFQRPSVFYLALNQTAFAPFKDKRVRQAFAMAINKDELIQSVHQGLPRKANGVLPVGVPGFDPDFKGIGYDPDAARRLLAEAGFPNGQGFPSLTLSFRAQVDDIRRTCEAMQDNLRKNLNIEVQLDAVEWTTFLNKRKAGAMPCYFLRWMADYLDAQNFLSVMLRTGADQNTIGYSNPAYDRLCDAADREQNATRRISLYREAERLVVDDSPWVPIYFQRDVELWSPRLKGLEDSLMGHLPHKRTYLGAP